MVPVVAWVAVADAPGGAWPLANHKAQAAATTAASAVSTHRHQPRSSGRCSGGGDNSYRTTHLVFAGAGLLSVLHLRRDAAYDPGGCVRVASIDAPYWLQNRGEPRPAQADSFAVRQGGAVYTAGRRSVDSSFWTKVDLTGLHEADLDLMAGSGPAYPGFSAGRLEFGYLTANSCGLGAGAPPCVEYQTRRRDRRLAASRSSLSTA